MVSNVKRVSVAPRAILPSALRVAWLGVFALGVAFLGVAALGVGADAWAADREAGVAVVPAASTTTLRGASRPLTALQLAAQHGMTYQDSNAFVMLEGRSLRLRMYPGRFNVVVAGQEYTVKDRIARSGRDVLLTSRVAGFLSVQIETFFEREALRLRLEHVAAARQPLPPLPRRTVVTRVRRPEPDARPLPLAEAAPSAVRPLPAGDGNWVPPAAERRWRWIVVHHSDDESGSLAKYDRFHRVTRHWENGCGYHFVIGNGTESGDGEIELGPRWVQQLQGAHAKTPDNRFNEQGIGICLVGDFHEHSAGPSQAQLDSLVRLVRWLSERYGIAAQDIRGHGDCCATLCPGRNFPWAEVRRRLD